MHDTLGSVGVAPVQLALPVTLIGRHSGSEIPNDAASSVALLAWQSSIGQFIFLESIEQERI
ncbi:MAG: hypothetical protein JO325_13610 [Solirubrobacterales bacterium]|nr:hypothetical protein [Solirubrobacterales bacterium]